MAKHPIHLHIDELVLEGLPLDQRERIAAAIQHEWERLSNRMDEAAEPEGGARHLASLDVTVNPHWSAEAIGREVARNVSDHLADSPRSPTDVS